MFAHGGDCAVDAGGVDIEVRHETQFVQAGGEHAARFQVRHQTGRTLALQIGEHDVGLRRLDDQARQALLAHLQQRGVLATGLIGLRFVTHLDVDAAGIDRTVAAVAEFMSA